MMYDRAIKINSNDVSAYINKGKIFILGFRKRTIIIRKI